jgi:hypothetical protein
MKPLTLDDLLPLEEYAPRRPEFVAALARYLDRHRRIRIGPRATLLFENRQTLWFRVQELLRVARLADPGRVQEELDVYNRLLPGPNLLQAALLIALTDEARLSEELSVWQTLQGEHLQLRVGDRHFASELVTCRPEDRAIGAAHWVRFQFDSTGKELLSDLARPAWFELSHPGYRHESAPLGEEIRQSLAEDLAASERD